MSKKLQSLKSMEELEHWIIQLSSREKRYRHGNTTYGDQEHALEIAAKFMDSEYFRTKFAGWKVTVCKMECNEWIDCGRIKPPPVSE